MQIVSFEELTAGIDPADANGFEIFNARMNFRAADGDVTAYGHRIRIVMRGKPGTPVTDEMITAAQDRLANPVPGRKGDVFLINALPRYLAAVKARAAAARALAEIDESFDAAAYATN